MCKSEPLISRQLRMMGWIPLVFLGLHFYTHWERDTLGHILWWCHMANLILSIGWMCASPGLIRIAVLWLIPGLPLWILDASQTGDWSVSSGLTHFGGLVMGLFLLRRVRAARWAWLHAFIPGFVLQQISRWATAAELNVNIAHGMREGWEEVFSSYWQYWLFTTLGILAALWGVNKVLQSTFPQQLDERKDHGIDSGPQNQTG